MNYAILCDPLRQDWAVIRCTSPDRWTVVCKVCRLEEAEQIVIMFRENADTVLHVEDHP